MARRTGKTSARRINELDRSTKALNLRRSGMSYDEISKAMGIAKGACHALVKRALVATADLHKEAADELRELEGARLDAIIAGHWEAATVDKDTRSADCVLKAVRLRMSLYGLDAPVKIADKHGNALAVLDFTTLVAMAVKLEAEQGGLTLDAESTPIAGPMLGDGGDDASGDT